MKKDPKQKIRIVVFWVLGVSALVCRHQNPDLLMRKLIRKVINILIIASYSDQSINPKGYEEPHLKVKKPNLLTRVKRGLLKPSEEKIMATKSKTGTISNLCPSMYRRRGLKKTVRCYLWTTGTPSKKWRRAVILLSRLQI